MKAIILGLLSLLMSFSGFNKFSNEIYIAAVKGKLDKALANEVEGTNGRQLKKPSVKNANFIS